MAFYCIRFVNLSLSCLSLFVAKIQVFHTPGLKPLTYIEFEEALHYTSDLERLDPPWRNMQDYHRVLLFRLGISNDHECTRGFSHGTSDHARHSYVRWARPMPVQIVPVKM